MQSSNCLVYLNVMSKRGLITPTVSKAWPLFKHWQLRHKSRWLSDSWWQQNSIPPSTVGYGPCSVWHWGAPCQASVAVLSVTATQAPRMPPEMEPWFSHEHGGLPGDVQGASCRPGKSRTTVTYTTPPFPPHASTLTHTQPYTHTQFRQVKHDMWAKLSPISAVWSSSECEAWEAECCPVSSTMENSVA